jgi:hypothetical protein
MAIVGSRRAMISERNGRAVDAGQRQRQRQRQRPKRMWRKEFEALQATSSPRAAF